MLHSSSSAIQDRLGKEDGVGAAVDIISQYMAKAVVPAQDALLRLARPSKPAADVPAVRQATPGQAEDAAEASTEAAGVPDAVSAAIDAASIQVLLHILLFVYFIVGVPAAWADGTNAAKLLSHAAKLLKHLD